MFSITKFRTNGRLGRTIVGTRYISYGWQLESDKEGTLQSGYEIRLFNGKEQIIWESGKVESRKTFNIYYSIPELKSKSEYFWDVKVWNNYGEIAQSMLVGFETALLHVQDWKAKWIEADMPVKSVKEEFNPGKVFGYNGGNSEDMENIKLDPPVVFKKILSVGDKPIKRGRIHITSHGIYEAELNGEKIGEEYLAPGFTTYAKLLYFQTHDITSQLKNGQNELAMTVADGWYKGRIGLVGIGHQFGDRVALLAQIEIEYEDGECVSFGTDRSFLASIGDIEYSDLFIGERQNRLKDCHQTYEVLEREYGFDNLKADPGEPVKCIEQIKAVKILRTPKGETVVDFGRVVAGIVEMKANGPAGCKIQLQHSEELDDQGNFFFHLMGQNKYQAVTYLLKGGAEETLRPRFTYQGFRYVMVTGYPGTISEDNFTALVLSSDCERTGRIETSNAKVNQLLENIYHSQQGNFISVPTDCPSREKGGWTGDAQVYTPTAVFNMKIDSFMKRWLENMRAEQCENGQIPGLVPFIESDRILSAGFGNISSAGWADACITIPWQLYLQYEDMSFLSDNYEMMKKWLGYVEARCASNVIDESDEHERYIWDMDFHYGDWFIPSVTAEDGSPDPMKAAGLTSKQAATMYFAYSAELLFKIANILGNQSDAAYYSTLSSKVKDAFVKVFVDEYGRILNDMQGLYAMAIHFNIGNDEVLEKFGARLAEKIEKNGNRLDTGFLGTPVLLDALTATGRKDLAYKLLLQEECPSWLYMVNQGATSIWEIWNAIKPDGTRSIISYNHYSLGSVQDYVVRKICGLTKSDAVEGRYNIEPDFHAPFQFIHLEHETGYGCISIRWESRDQGRMLELEIPAGVQVRLLLAGQADRELRSGTYRIPI